MAHRRIKQHFYYIYDSTIAIIFTLLVGTSYVRWGRKTCENDATLVYKGK